MCPVQGASGYWEQNRTPFPPTPHPAFSLAGGETQVREREERDHRYRPVVGFQLDTKCDEGEGESNPGGGNQEDFAEEMSFITPRLAGGRQMGVGRRVWKRRIAGRRTGCAKDPGVGTDLVNHRSAGCHFMHFVVTY